MSKLFYTGYLKDTTSARHKQGLMSQEVVSVCILKEKGSVDNVVCNNPTMTPFPATKMVYTDTVIADTCPCVRYVLPS